jgi:tape measure domain-containing protein
MNLEDLNFLIKIDFDGALAEIPKIESGMKAIKAEVSGLNAVGSLSGLQSAVHAIKEETAGVQFNLEALTRTFTTAAVAAQPLALISTNMGVLSSVFGLAAKGASHLAAAAGLVVNVLKYLYSGIQMVIWPLQGLVIIPKMIAAAFSMMFAIIIAPFRILIGMAKLAFGAIMAIVRPVLAVAEAFFRFKLFVMGLSLQIKLFSRFMSILPPQLKILFVGLIALGAAGRAGALAVRLTSLAIKAVTFAAMAAVNPVRALGVAAMAVVKSLAMLAVRATMAAVSLARMAVAASVSAMRSLAGMAVNAAVAIGNRLVSAIKSGVTGFMALGAAAMAWGVKTAAGAEMSAVMFGTMLKDMGQGAALMREMNKWAGAPLFDQKGLQDAGRFLLKAGVSADQVTTKLDQLGAIALVTKNPIEDIARIYQRGMTVGKFQTGLINDMAERGIDIWHGLAEAIGVSVPEVQAMAEAGEIGPAEMNAALEKLTTGTGIYAGAIQNVAQTWSGMASTIWSNTQLALGALLGMSTEGSKSWMASAVAITEGWKTSFAAMSPVVAQFVAVIGDAFNTWLSFASFVWTNVYGMGEATFSNLLTVGMEWATKFRWFFQNLGDLARFSFMVMQLAAVTAFNDIGYFFTDKAPVYLQWFQENWRAVFWDAAMIVTTVFKNIGINIFNAMQEIWDFIASGGTNSMEFAFTPLLDGFKSTIEEMPVIAARGMTETETALTDSINGLGANLADNYDQMMNEAMAGLNVQPVEVQLQPSGGAATEGEGTGGTGGQKRTNFAVGSMERGSEAALNAIYAAQNRDKTPQQQLGVLKKIEGHMAKVANKPEPMLQGAVG